MKFFKKILENRNISDWLMRAFYVTMVAIGISILFTFPGTSIEHILLRLFGCTTSFLSVILVVMSFNYCTNRLVASRFLLGALAILSAVIVALLYVDHCNVLGCPPQIVCQYTFMGILMEIMIFYRMGSLSHILHDAERLSDES